MKCPPWYVAALIAICVAGCLAPRQKDRPPTDLVDHEDEKKPGDVAGSAVSFSMDAEQFANLAKWLGHKNSCVIENAVHVEQNNVTLDAQSGTRFSYEMLDDSGLFTFEKPYPTIKTGFANLIGGVSLQSVLINSDGTGIASTKSFGRYRFRWCDQENELTQAVNEKSEVWAYSSPGCVPCAKAKSEFEAAGEDLPFRVVWKEEAPTWLGSRPGFWWHVRGDRPSQSDVANTRQHQGWAGLKDMQARWKASRK